ncbi:hypothetical protein L1987_46020 [Smallanthus sonchifolius]|uniref:Uncharacterized protein n=1 Tax=Smallanthus sonchifolius TaxID=185202 RepID=A0ACB9G0A0_9ASTR|nr:hypothetical protein L1987_46020 [Smallanthus sonchifolius]
MEGCEGWIAQLSLKPTPGELRRYVEPSKESRYVKQGKAILSSNTMILQPIHLVVFVLKSTSTPSIDQRNMFSLYLFARPDERRKVFRKESFGTTKIEVWKWRRLRWNFNNKNHKGAMMEMGEGLCKLRKLNFESGPFHQFERDVSAVLDFIYQTQLEFAACNDDMCVAMDHSETSYKLLGGYGAGQHLYWLEMDGSVVLISVGLL